MSLFKTHENQISDQAPSRQQCGPLDSTDILIAMGLALTAATVTLHGLGAQSLATWDEAIYGVVTRELLAHPGLTLYYGGVFWFEKPPFLFWLMAASSSAFGLTEFALRLPTAIFAIGAVVLQYFAGRRLEGRLAGIMAAVLLLGLPQFVAYSRLAMTDVPLAALGTLSMVFVLYGEKRSALTAAAGAAFGLAVLTKSAASFLFLPGLLAIVVAQRGIAYLWSREMLLALALALAIALPWHIWSVVTYGHTFIDQYLVFHVLGRFAGSLEGHEGGPFYYFDMYRHNAGWFAFVHAGGVALGLLLAILQRDRLLAALVLFAAAAFAIVNAQGTKIGWYLTPVYPSAALAAAVAITRILPNLGARLAAVLLAIVLAVPAVIDGREVFVENYNILDYSPEVRSLRNMRPFMNKPIPVLYTIDVSDPAARFYLADQIRSIDQTDLERPLAANHPFLCLTLKPTALELVNSHSYARIEIVASTESLAVIEHR